MVTETCRARAVALLAMLLVAGCSLPHDGAPYQDLDESSPMVRKLREIGRETGRVPLRTITGGDWDTVYVHKQEGWHDRDAIEEDVGGPIAMPNNPARDVWVTFVRDGRPQRVVGLPLGLWAGRYGPDVLVVNTRPGESNLQLTEPPPAG